MSLEDTVKACVSQLEQEHQMVAISVQLVDSELARLYESSERAIVSSTGIGFWFDSPGNGMSFGHAAHIWSCEVHACRSLRWALAL